LFYTFYCAIVYDLLREKQKCSSKLPKAILPRKEGRDKKYTKSNYELNKNTMKQNEKAIYRSNENQKKMECFPLVTKKLR
jgi:hypothetical protein